MTKAPIDIRDTPSPFGVLAFLDWNHDWNDHMYDTREKLTQAVDSMADAGVKMVRQVISWDEVEPERGRFTFSKYDRILDELSRRDIRMLGVLCYTAHWAGRAWNAAPNKELFGIYVAKTVERYKNRIKYWELWNEPDQRIYWETQDGMKTYVELLKTIYPLIKEIDRTAVLVLGSVCGPRPLREMYPRGAKPFFDVVNVHPFVSPLTRDAVNRVHKIYAGVRRVMIENDDESKPIWFTELGCPGVRDPHQSKGWWQGRSPSEKQQASWLRTVYHEALQWPGVKRIFWAFLQETKHFGDDIDAFGLVTRDFTPKPAFDAYRQVARSWKEGLPRGRQKLSDAGGMPYRRLFRRQ